MVKRRRGQTFGSVRLAATIAGAHAVVEAAKLVAGFDSFPEASQTVASASAVVLTFILVFTAGRVTEPQLPKKISGRVVYLLTHG
jgi:hypothetical protein